MSSGYFIPPPRKFATPDAPYICPVEHEGDPYVQLTTEPVAVEKWTCCDEETVLGEIVDCDTCLQPGISSGGIPPGWIEDTNGAHCPRCQPPA